MCPIRRLQIEFQNGEIKTYDSIKDASRKLNYNYNTFYNAIKNERRYRGNKYSFIN